MNKIILRSLCLMLALVLVAAIGLVPSPAQAAEPTASDIAIQDGVTLHCWNWSFSQIEANMEKIAAMGYTSIQTSPIQTAKQATAGYPSNDWWVYYQPAAFRIDNTGESALGTKADFEKMCQTAHQYGIKVIVDVVANHMGNMTANDLAITILPDLRLDNDCWHDITKNTSNYSNRFDVTQYCMAGLPDLNTANKKVQNYVLDFLKECIDAGADGFRFDGAKHIETPDDGNCASDFWPTVVNGATSYAKSSRNIDLYCYGEVLDAPGGSLSINSYTKYMSVTDNTWGTTVLSNVVSAKNESAYFASYHKNTEASKLVLWAESHDTFADKSTSSASDESINKTWALVASRADAMGLYLARPANMSQTLGVGSITGWSYAEVAAVNAFHNAFIGQSEYLANENGIAYVERGNAGVVLVNCKGNDASVSVTAHAMADGTYTDAITGNSFTVSGGKISGQIGSTGIAVVYNTDSCAHTAHDTDGFCTACLVQVGHDFSNNGKCACGKTEIPDRTIYFTNSGNWSTVNFYSWYTPENIVSDAWPGTAMTKVEGNIYSCTVPADAPNIIFNDGSIQTEDLSIPALSGGKNMYDFVTKEWTVYGAEEPPAETTPTEPSESQSATEPTDSTCEEPAPAGINPIVFVIVGGVAVVAAVVVILLLKKKS
ncbi:MAG: starch-binding protein [Oscillospiraceae bacterium]|nr:starch-binding protein [Oscillospiraceae bacterium]